MTLRDKDTRSIVTTNFTEKASIEHFGIGGKRVYFHEDVKKAILKYKSYLSKIKFQDDYYEERINMLDKIFGDFK